MNSCTTVAGPIPQRDYENPPLGSSKFNFSLSRVCHQSTGNSFSQNEEDRNSAEVNCGGGGNQRMVGAQGNPQIRFRKKQVPPKSCPLIIWKSELGPQVFFTDQPLKVPAFVISCALATNTRQWKDCIIQTQRGCSESLWGVGFSMCSYSW